MEINDKKTEFSLIYKKEADFVFRYILLRVANREEAIDILQETFTKFWQAFSEGTSIGHPRAFIFTIARNEIIDWYRKKKPASLEAMAEQNEDGIFEIKDEKMHEDIALSAEASVVMKAVGKISPQNREAIYLRFVEDLSPTEIADILHATPNAISIRLNRGLQELRDHLRIELE
jgi:RNA polymerase sigma-70 factor (ECF subfamily)